MSAELIIQNGNTLYYPTVLEGIDWSTERYGSPGKLTFKCMYDESLVIEEGNPVRFRWNDQNVFYGFIFSMSRDKEPVLSITAYDQLRYFKNKDTYVIEGERADEKLKEIIADFKLNGGIIDNTKYAIPSLVEDNKSLFDIMQDCLDQTLTNTGEMFVLHDDFGKLSLQSTTSLIRDTLIDADTGQNFDFSSSIDENTYNVIKLVYDNEKSGKRDVYMTKDSANINKWGVLQFYDKLQDGENGQAKVEALIKLYNKKTRSLKVSKAIGDVSVKAGCLIPVILDLGLAKVQSLMLVESCKHSFKENEDFMDLTLRGGGVV